MDKQLDNSIDLYTLFSDLTELDNSCNTILNQLSITDESTINSKFIDFCTMIDNYFGEYDIIHKSLFFGAHLLTPATDFDPNNILEYEKYLMEENNILSPYYVLSIYYTIEYLINSQNAYMYRDYMSQLTSNRMKHKDWTPYTPDSTFHKGLSLPSTRNYYNSYHDNKSFSKELRQNTKWTKELQKASASNPFHALINYEITSCNFYFLNGFLPDVSSIIADKVAFSKMAYDRAHNISQENNHLKADLTEKLSTLFSYYFNCIEKLNLEHISSFADRAIRIMKLEYSMGVLTLSPHLKQMSVKRYQPSENGIWKDLMLFQKTPSFPERLFYKEPPTIHEIKLLSICLSKHLLSICYMLCNRDLNKLHEQLRSYINNMHEYHKTYNLTAEGTSYDNLWYFLHTIDTCLCNSNERYDFLNGLQRNIADIKEVSWYIDFSKYYWYQRFTDDWWESTKSLYKSDVSYIFENIRR